MTWRRKHCLNSAMFDKLPAFSQWQSWRISIFNKRFYLSTQNRSVHSNKGKRLWYKFYSILECLGSTALNLYNSQKHFCKCSTHLKTKKQKQNRKPTILWCQSLMSLKYLSKVLTNLDPRSSIIPAPILGEWVSPEFELDWDGPFQNSH